MTASEQDGRGTLLLCAFDHRDFFERLAAEHAGPALSRFATVAGAKELVLEAALAVRDRAPAEQRDGLGVFVDEQYGAHVALRARTEGLVLAMPAERSGAPEFQCEFGDRFAAHIEALTCTPSSSGPRCGTSRASARCSAAARPTWRASRHGWGCGPPSSRRWATTASARRRGRRPSASASTHCSSRPTRRCAPRWPSARSIRPTSSRCFFYRAPVDPDLTLEAAELPVEALTSARAVWVTGTGLSREPSLSTTMAALRVRPAGALTVLDLDHRPELWDDVADAGPRGRAALAHCTVAVGNRTEVATVVEESDAEAAARALLDLGVQLAVVKLGPEGVLAATADEVVHVPPQPVDVVNGLGAGDAFGGALVHGLLAGLSLRRTVQRANAAGALVAGRLGCADDMPELAEIERMVGEDVR